MHKRANPILLVEDDPDDAELTRLALTRLGLEQQVVHVADGLQALDWLFRRGEFGARTTADPQLVLLDLKMPLLDGIAVLREVKGSESLRHVPVVVMTSSTEPGDLRRAYEAGANAYVAKPTEFPHFLATLQRLCDFWIDTNLLAPPAPTGTWVTNFGELL
jgi:CheY-like chemotaxis protein